MLTGLALRQVYSGSQSGSPLRMCFGSFAARMAGRLSNFAFLQTDWPAFHDAAAKAEALAYPDARTACFHARRELEVSDPPFESQREFARRVTAVEALKTAPRASLAELDALFATPQRRAFKGEL